MQVATTTVRCPRCGTHWEQSLDLEQIGTSPHFVIETTPAEHLCPARVDTEGRAHLQLVV